MRKVIRLLLVLALVLVSCGGDEEAGDGRSDNSTDAVPSSTTTTTTTTTTTSGGGTSGDDWCQSAETNVADVELNPLAQTPEQLQATVEQFATDIGDAADRAPAEIEDDVRLFADAYNDLVEFFEEYEWNFLAIPEEDLADERLNRFDDAAFEEAANNIEEYCGFEFIARGPGGGSPDTGGDTGSVPVAGSGLSDTFPVELIPPGGELLGTVDVGGAESATWDVEAPLDELVAFYEDALGAPSATSDDGVLWITAFEGRQLSVALAEVGDGFVGVGVTIAP